MNILHSRENAIKFITEFLDQVDVRGKYVIDLSAGTGYVANLWQQKGANVFAYDLYPELMSNREIPACQINLNQPFPIEPAIADYVLLMETIDHISEQKQLFDEIARVVKPGGYVIITKPNNSNISGRWANFWLESERSDMFLPNEKSVIGYDEGRTYMGRIFLIGILKLRTLAGISGLKIYRLYKNQFSFSSLISFMLVGWYFLLRGFITYKKSIKGADEELKTILREQYLLNKNPTVLFYKHICMVLKKPENA